MRTLTCKSTYTLLIISILFVSSFIASTQAILSHKTIIQSNGTISSDLSNAKLMGVDHCWWGEMHEGMFDLVKNCGGNVWREHMWYSSWRDDVPYWKDPSVTFRSRMREMMKWADERGIKIIVAPMGYDEIPVSWSQFDADVILNKDGLGDRWISGWSEVIDEFQPYAIDILNEPMGVYGTTYESSMTQTEFFEAYRQFCIRAIRAWRQIKPDIVGIINGCPFWDLKPLAANPIPEPNLFYAIHYYYAYNGTVDVTKDPPANIAYYEGRLSEAETLLESFLLNNEGIQAAQDAGLQILMQETGTCSEAPNWNVFMQDMYDFCKAHNIGVIHHALEPYPKNPAGLLNEDWVTLNDLGQLWYQNMQV